MIHDRGLAESPILTPFYIGHQRNFHQAVGLRELFKKNASDGRAKGKLFFVHCGEGGLEHGYTTIPPQNGPTQPTLLHLCQISRPIPSWGSPLYTLDFEFPGKFVVNFWSKRPAGFFFYDKLERRSRRKLIPARNFDELILLFLFRSDGLGSFGSSGQKFATHPVRGW